MSRKVIAYVGLLVMLGWASFGPAAEPPGEDRTHRLETLYGYGPPLSPPANWTAEPGSTEALEVYADALARASAGDAQGQLGVGMAYLWGYGTERDKAEALRWMEQAARQGNGQAQMLLAVLYARGSGDQDIEKAERFALAAAKQGVAHAHLLLSLLYLDPDRGEFSPTKAIKHAEEAERLGLVLSQNIKDKMDDVKRKVDQLKEQEAIRKSNHSAIDSSMDQALAHRGFHLQPNGLPDNGLSGWSNVFWFVVLLGIVISIGTTIGAELKSRDLYLSDGSDRSRRINAYLLERRRSPAGAAILAAFLGPLGYMYASLGGGAFYLIASILAWFLLWWLAVPVWMVMWLMMVAGAPVNVLRFNKRLVSQAELLAGQ
jgi:hypothetical protein